MTDRDRDFEEWWRKHQPVLRVERPDGSFDAAMTVDVGEKVKEVERAAYHAGAARERVRLKPWLYHKLDCGFTKSGPVEFDCTCGLAAALKGGE